MQPSFRPPRPLARLAEWLGHHGTGGVSRPSTGGAPLAGGDLSAYVALGHWSPGAVPLGTRLELLVGQLAAELSACQWCIDQARHRWLKAFFPREHLRQLRAYETSAVFSESERAALALVEAVALHTERDRLAPAKVLERARRHFAEPEVARIAAAAAAEHFFDPATGALGRDAVIGREGGVPWRAIETGISVRGLS
jgi:alkylhydroperoxidase family enzyme